MRFELDGQGPVVAGDAWVAETAVLAGRVRIGAGASVWHHAVLRAEFEDITVGERSNVQDGCVLHVDPGYPLTIGAGVSIGHNAVLHGCAIADDVLIGMSATVLNGARIEAECLVAAGAVVAQGAHVPAGSLVAGVPAKVRRELTEDERALIRANAEVYLELATKHSSARPIS